MPHKCVKCGSVFEENDPSIIRGCTKCGSVFFLFIRTQKDFEEVRAIQDELKAKDTTLEEEIVRQIEVKKIEKEVKGKKAQKKIRKKFEIETLRIPKEGVYEINIDALMNRKPLIILERGKTYIIHLPSLFDRVKERN